MLSDLLHVEGIVAHFALVVVDDESRWIFVALLKSASAIETAAAIRKVIQTVAMHSDDHVLKIQIIRSDNDTEFINSEVQSMIVQAGIKHETS